MDRGQVWRGDGSILDTYNGFQGHMHKDMSSGQMDRVSEAQERGLGSRQIRVSWAPAGRVSLSMGSSCGVMREKEPARDSEEPQLSGH